MLVFSTGLLAGYLLDTVRVALQDHDISPGSTIDEQSPAGIRLISLTTKELTVTAQRSLDGSPFEMQTTFSDGRPSQHCKAPPNLIQPFASIVAKREITFEQRDKDFPVQIGVLDIRNVILPEPAGPILVFTNAKHNAVAYIRDGYAVEVIIPFATLKALEHGCSIPAAK